MNALRQFASLLCLGTAFLFLANLCLCGVEATGMLACVADSAAHADTPSPLTGDGAAPGEHCDDCHTHSPLAFAFSAKSLAVDFSASARVRHIDEFAPDGPVREIDYPPQLS